MYKNINLFALILEVLYISTVILEHVYAHSF